MSYNLGRYYPFQFTSLYAVSVVGMQEQLFDAYTSKGSIDVVWCPSLEYHPPFVSCGIEMWGNKGLVGNAQLLCAYIYIYIYICMQLEYKYWIIPGRNSLLLFFWGYLVAVVTTSVDLGDTWPRTCRFHLNQNNIIFTWCSKTYHWKSVIHRCLLSHPQEPMCTLHDANTIILLRETPSQILSSLTDCLSSPCFQWLPSGPMLVSVCFHR